MTAKAATARARMDDTTGPSIWATAEGFPCSLARTPAGWKTVSVIKRSDPFGGQARSTYRATKLREPGRTGTT
jgi:hypothetical protein